MNKEKLENIFAAIAICHNNIIRLTDQIDKFNNNIKEFDNILWQIAEDLKDLKYEK